MPSSLVCPRSPAAIECHYHATPSQPYLSSFSKEMHSSWASKQIKHAAFVKAWKLGNSNRALMKIFGISQSTVDRWKIRAPQQVGRPVSEARLARIKTAARIARRTHVVKGKNGVMKRRPDHPTCQKVSDELWESFGHDVCAETVRRDLRAAGVVSKRRGRHPNLTNARNRVAFAKRMLADDAMREAIVYSDEHAISTNDSSSQTQLVKAGQPTLPREKQRVQNIPSFMVFAAIGVGYKSPLIILPKKDPTDAKKSFTLNAERYMEICVSPLLNSLRKVAPSGRRRIFMQDGAKCHTAKVTKAFISRAGVLLLEGHPASSPDMNPIEALWAEFNRRISLAAPFDDDSLQEAAYDVWASFTQEEIDAFVLHQKAACESVVRARGL